MITEYDSHARYLAVQSNLPIIKPPQAMNDHGLIGVKVALIKILQSVPFLMLLISSNLLPDSNKFSIQHLVVWYIS